MLYVTTRVSADAFTANRALSENRGPEGGFYLPMRMPEFSRQQIAELGNKSFSENAAMIINMLFGTDLDGWDVEFGIGRYPVKLRSLGGRVCLAQTWHNPMWNFGRLVSGTEKAIRQSDQINSEPSDWMMISARIAVLFGIYGELLQKGTLQSRQQFDIAVPSADFSLLMAAWYARSWGLPIGMIVCCCNENNSMWHLFHKGELRTDLPAVKTSTPLCDCTVPTDLERLIFGVFGNREARRFYETCRLGGTFTLEEAQLEQLRTGIHVSVVSSRRMASAIPNLYQTSGCVAQPYTALCHCGLTDYRAAAGEARQALIISEESPVFSLDFLSGCMGLDPVRLKQMIDE